VSKALDQAFVWIDEIFDELRLPGVSKGTFMGRPSLKHLGKSIVGSKDGENLVVHRPLDIKELLLDAEPATYFETDHYRGSPALLMRPEKIEKTILRARIDVAWRMAATKRQLLEFDGRTA
jgi:hypothetical protein